MNRQAISTIAIILSILLLASCSGTTVIKSVTQTQNQSQIQSQTETLTITQSAVTETATITETSLIKTSAITVTVTPPEITNETMTITPQPPILTWIATTLITRWHYQAGILMGCTVYQNLKVTEGSGEVEISVAFSDVSGVPQVSNSEVKSTFFMENGRSYSLSIKSRML